MHTGTVPLYWQLVLSRVFIGIGEARWVRVGSVRKEKGASQAGNILFYDWCIPFICSLYSFAGLAPTIIDDSAPQSRKASWLAAFFIALPGWLLIGNSYSYLFTIEFVLFFERSFFLSFSWCSIWVPYSWLFAARRIFLESPFHFGRIFDDDSCWFMLYHPVQTSEGSPFFHIVTS